MSCTTGQIQQGLDDFVKENKKPTTSEVTEGLKEALRTGVQVSISKASVANGFSENDLIRIPFPPDAIRVAEKLRQLGLGNEVDRFEKALNKAAEEAVKQAGPIFMTAITEMSIGDAWEILNGDNHAATQYLYDHTADELFSNFRPVVQTNLDNVNATAYYGQLVSTYNKIPFVDKVDPNLDYFATQKAIEGLFKLIELEEEKIREDPAARTSDLLRKVFGYSH
jgi:hypothetical protein